MKDPDTTLDAATQIAVEHRAELKPDHRELLDLVLADQGIETATREHLVEHLLEEESPRLLQALARVKAGRADIGAASGAIPRGFTVGSLRAEPSVAPASKGTVGSLRGER